MKRLNYHSSNLIALSPLKLNLWSDRIFFQYLIESFAENNAYLVSTNSRPYNEYKEIIEDAEKIIPKDFILFSRQQKRYAEFRWYVATQDLKDNIVELIYTFWNSFEQVSLVFTSEIDKYISVDIRNTFWEDLTKLSESYIFYRGLEDDVLWIGKSSTLNFPEINLEDNFLKR